MTFNSNVVLCAKKSTPRANPEIIAKPFLTNSVVNNLGYFASKKVKYSIPLSSCSFNVVWDPIKSIEFILFKTDLGIPSILLKSLSDNSKIDFNFLQELHIFRIREGPIPFIWLRA